MLEKIYNGKHLSKLDKIMQWEDKETVRSESVSTHSYKTTVFCSVLLDDVFPGFDNPEWNTLKVKCMNRALFHDWDETFISRDISHEVKYNKYNGECIRDTLDKYARAAAAEDFGLKSVIGSSMFLDKAADFGVYSIVKLCDWMAMSYFIKREQSLGNTSLNDVIPMMVTNMQRCCESVKDFVVMMGGKEAVLNKLIESLKTF